MRAALGSAALGAGVLLAACSSGGSDWLEVYQITKSTWERGTHDVSMQEAAAVPYASMGVRVGSGPQVMIVLAGDTASNELWTSAARIALTTHDGRIIRSAGLAHDLGGYEFKSDEAGPKNSRIVRWLADFPDLGLYGVPIRCTDEASADETISILGTAIRTKRINESCRSETPALDWKFRNTYWSDPDSGLVWRSVQHIHPKLDEVETEILRPPA